MNQKMQIIHCSPNRCDNCINSSESGCQKIISGMKEEFEIVLLLEKQRGLIHIIQRNNLLVNDTPWYSDNWESMFIGPDSNLFDSFDDLIGVYPVGPYLSLFFKPENDYHTKCEYLPIVRTSLELSLLNRLLKESKSFIKSIKKTEKSENQQLMNIEQNVSNYIEEQIPEINNITKKRLAQIVAHRSKIFGLIYPILLDEMVEEIYLDGPETRIYFDHQKMGRCITSLSYNLSEISRIITFIRFQSNLHLDRSNPSLKMNLNIFETNLRLSASVPPLSVDGLHLEIRRARKKPYLIRDLIDNGTMTYSAAAIMLLALACRLNITITGGPGAGKTTILNALDMATPRQWRKIYIEDAIESRAVQNQHQVRLQVDPVDEKHSRINKSEEIVKCLHRSPDYIILGEIQTREHSKALFQAIAAGLHSIQTCHSNSAASLISRWIMDHGIERTSLGLMDLIVSVERPKPGKPRRYVKEIVEIRKGVRDGVLTFLGTNTVYDGRTNIVTKWVDDGAFITHAKNHGIDNPELALDLLIKYLQYNEERDFEKLVEELWYHGHPMKYVGK